MKNLQHKGLSLSNDRSYIALGVFYNSALCFQSVEHACRWPSSPRHCSGTSQTAFFCVLSLQLRACQQIFAPPDTLHRSLVLCSWVNQRVIDIFCSCISTSARTSPQFMVKCYSCILRMRSKITLIFACAI